MRGFSCAAIAWAFFESAAGLKISGEPGCAESVPAELHFESSRFGCTAPDHAVSVDAVHCALSCNTRLARGRAEKGFTVVIADSSSLDVCVEIFLELMVDRHLVLLTTPR